MIAKDRNSRVVAALLFGLGFLFAGGGIVSQAGPAEHSRISNGKIGTVDFQVSCDEAVRAKFDQALGLMHHMMYDQARSA